MPAYRPNDNVDLRRVNREEQEGCYPSTSCLFLRVNIVCPIVCWLSLISELHYQTLGQFWAAGSQTLWKGISFESRDCGRSHRLPVNVCPASGSRTRSACKKPLAEVVGEAEQMAKSPRDRWCWKTLRTSIK